MQELRPRRGDAPRRPWSRRAVGLAHLRRVPGCPRGPRRHQRRRPRRPHRRAPSRAGRRSRRAHCHPRRDRADAASSSREALQGGALGLSTNRNDRHMREDGKPVASRLADDAELFALCDVLREPTAGVIETVLGLHHVDAPAPGTTRSRAARGRPIIWQSVLHRWAEPDLWREQLTASRRTFRDGYRAYGLDQHRAHRPAASTLKNAQVFDEFPTWKNLMFLPELVRKQAFAEPETRAKLRAEMAAPERPPSTAAGTSCGSSRGPPGERASTSARAWPTWPRMRGQDPLDAFLDLSLEEDLETTFWSANTGGDPEATARSSAAPTFWSALSDAGRPRPVRRRVRLRHDLLGFWVRERARSCLGAAVHKLTFQVAPSTASRDRGLRAARLRRRLGHLRPGDGDRPRGRSGPTTTRPNTGRLIQRADGHALHHRQRPGHLRGRHSSAATCPGTSCAAPLASPSRRRCSSWGLLTFPSPASARSRRGEREACGPGGQGRNRRQHRRRVLRLQQPLSPRGRRARTCRHHGHRAALRRPQHCFDLRTGKCASARARPALTVLPVEQRDEDICVQLEW